jgi:hypothetical protein
VPIFQILNAKKPKKANANPKTKNPGGINAKKQILGNPKNPKIFQKPKTQKNPEKTNANWSYSKNQKNLLAKFDLLHEGSFFGSAPPTPREQEVDWKGKQC